MPSKSTPADVDRAFMDALRALDVFTLDNRDDAPSLALAHVSLTKLHAFMGKGIGKLARLALPDS